MFKYMFLTVALTLLSGSQTIFGCCSRGWVKGQAPIAPEKLSPRTAADVRGIAEHGAEADTIYPSRFTSHPDYLKLRALEDLQQEYLAYAAELKQASSKEPAFKELTEKFHQNSATAAELRAKITHDTQHRKSAAGLPRS